MYLSSESTGRALNNKNAVKRGLVAGLATLALIAGGGCGKTQEPAPPGRQPYANLGLRPNTPGFLQGTVMERVEVGNTGQMAVTSFGLAVNLRYPGDTRAPVPVREWMIKEMYRLGFGRATGFSDLRRLQPEQVLQDKRVAVVMVGAYVPPGARVGQRTDVVVQALPGSDTASLAGATLYQCELRLLGANALNPGGSVNAHIAARGPVFINPAFALEVPTPGAGGGGGENRTGSRVGTILGGGVCTTDRPIHLRLRTPQWNVAKVVEQIINERFQTVADKPRANGQGMCVAEAQDEGYINLYVPAKYQKNWEHFVAVVNHLYLTVNPAAAAMKARELVAEAKKPEALLADISYALEGLGTVAIPYIGELLTHPSPDVAFAAAKAGTYLGDAASEIALGRMAQTAGHPFRVDAIQVLGDVPPSPAVARAVSPCLDADDAQVRIAAYKVLSQIDDARIPNPVMSRKIHDSFILDVIETTGKPMVYATRVGEPRIAVFGSRSQIRLPITFSAFDTRLTITQDARKPQLLSVFYRGEEMQEPVAALSRPLIVELAARLGGGSDDKFRFSYGEIVAMLQTMADTGKVASSFVLQDIPGLEEQFGDIADASSGRSVGEAQPATPQPATGLAGTSPMAPPPGQVVNLTNAPRPNGNAPAAGGRPN
ncbi:MAG TPA: flagellar basal body P-ring protein FlgI [Tepidisphaeraceae bacterium]|nr:flagellar basal body P-ring protein FlgI [Tepidisphaeraceae bacterium]